VCVVTLDARCGAVFGSRLVGRAGNRDGGLEAEGACGRCPESHGMLGPILVAMIVENHDCEVVEQGEPLIHGFTSFCRSLVLLATTSLWECHVASLRA
jgi:hypothetical protein